MTLLRVAPICFATALPGCASLLNGVSDKITAQSPTPGARVFVDGFDATRQSVVVPNDRPHVLLVRAPGYADRVVSLEPHVKAVPIALDALLAVPTLFIAPLVDLCTGWWSAIDASSEPITLAPVVALSALRPRPTYAVGAVALPAQAVLREAAPALPPVASAPTAPPPVALAPEPAPVGPLPAPASKAVPAPVVENGKAAVVRGGTPTAAQKPNCDPNFAFDEQGRKHFKPACFLSPKR